MTSSATSSTAADATPARSAWSRLSLRARVAINVVAITAVIQLALGAAVFLYFRTTVDDFFDSRLAVRLRWAAAELAQNSATSNAVPTNATLAAAAERTIRLVTFSSLVLVLRDEEGRVLATSDPGIDVSMLPTPHRLDPAAIDTAMVVLPHIGTGDDDKSPARTATISIAIRGTEGRPAYLTAAITNTSAAQMNDLIGRAVLLASTLGLLATGCAAWFITGLALKPLSQLSSVAEEFSLERIDEPSQLQPQTPELAHLASELDAARTRIRLVLQANERFIANVSHELKTPVAVLRTEAQTLDATDIPPQTRVFVRSVIEETRRLGSMVDSFLTLATVRSGKSLNTSTPVYVNDVVVESLSHCAAMARQHHVTLLPGLYEGEDDLIIAGDADLLRVLLDNLLRNAIRFSPPGSTVAAEISATDASATVSILDSGPGIPDELLATIFERFSLALPEAVVGRGHGLGLSIAQGIAELHGGLISTSNPPRGGCRFTLTIPRLHLPSTNGTAAAQPPAGVQPPPKGTPTAAQSA